jgi:cob(I)alamin adenosyltransferase
LGNGVRVDKDSPPIETLGAIDELNSWVGALRSISKVEQVKRTLVLVQHDLFDLGAQISVPGTALLSRAHLLRIEQSFEQMNAELGMLKEFILPGGSLASAFAQIARTVCRRAERRLFSLLELDAAAEGLRVVTKDTSEVESFGLSYLNRLSDLLFVAARIENGAAGHSDVLWEREKSLGAGT